MVQIKQNLVSESKYGIKCPNTMDPQYITIHNTANDASAANEISYMIDNSNEVSFHYAVDDIEAVQGILTNRNAWHCGDGNGTGNRKSIGIEICYSESGGDKYYKAESNAAELTAILLKEHGISINNVKQHNNWSGKNCPHRIRAEGTWDEFLNRVKAAMGETVESTSPPSQPSTPSESNDSSVITYRVYTKESGWLPWVESAEKYAGIKGQKVLGIQFKGNVEYQVHVTSGKWYSWIKGYNTTDSMGYAGDLKTPIDAIRIKNTTYRVAPCDNELNDYYNWITHYNTTDSMGYAGSFGKSIDQLQAKPSQTTPPSSSKTTYRVYANGKWYGWIEGYNTTDLNGYAGVVGSQIMGVQIQGDVEYRVRTTDGKWWSWIKGYNTTNSNGYAGTLNKPIDAIQIKNKTYRVSPVKSNYLGWITHYNTTDSMGYAGSYGKAIDRLQIQ